MTKKILIIQLRPGLGDFCMFLPRCHEVAKKNPDYDITILTKKNSKADQLLTYDPFIKNIEFIDKDDSKMNIFDLFKFIKKNNFEKVYSYQYGPKYLKYIILSKLCGVSEIYYYGIFKKKEGMVKKSIEANEEWLNIKINEFKGCIYNEKFNESLEKKIIIGLGASGDNKRWPIKFFIELIQNLNMKSKYLFILAGGGNEKEIIKEIVSTVSDANFYSLENSNVLDSIKKISDSFFFVGNDTGFMHVSACLNIKTFCIYGDTPSEDSKYNDKIIPILPPGVEETYHNDLAMIKIKPAYVLSTILKTIN